MASRGKPQSRALAWLTAAIGVQGLVSFIWILYERSLHQVPGSLTFWLASGLLALFSIALLAWAVLARSASPFTNRFWQQMQWLRAHLYPWVFAAALALFIAFTSFLILWFSDSDVLLNSLSPVLSAYFFLVLLDLILVYILRVRKPQLRGGDRPLGIALLFIFAFWLFIFLTRIGLAPDEYFWNVAGVPVLLNQVAAVLLAALLGDQLLAYLKRRSQARSRLQKSLLVLTCLLIWALTAFFWLRAPLAQSVFVEGPWLPNQDYVPHSDAATIDLGAQYMIIGEGLEKTHFTEKPLYTFFLGILHFFSGETYLGSTNLQILVLAVLPVLFYLLGRQLGGEFLGLSLALFAAVKEFNAIFGMWQISVSNSRLYMSELPLTVLLLAFALALFLWFRRHTSPATAPLAAGGLLGFAAMVRTNPVIFILLVPIFALAAYRTQRRLWWRAVRLFFLGLILTMGPWMLYTQIRYGTNPILYKIDSVIRTRVTHQPQKMPPTGITAEGPLIFTNHREPLVDSLQTPPPEAPPQEQQPSGTQTAPLLPTQTTHLPLIETSAGPAAEPALLDPVSPLVLAGHFFNNQIKALFVLPFQAYPLELEPVLNLPYWQEPVVWQGSLPFHHALAMVVNLLLIAIGLSFAWRHFSWAGLVPLLVNLGYYLANALARTSGSRYLLPADWTLWLYWLMGILAILAAFDPALEALPQPSPGLRSPSLWRTAVLLLLIGAAIPALNLAFPKRYVQQDKYANFKHLPLEKINQAIELTPQRVQHLLEKPGSDVVYGKMIYLRYGDNWLTNSKGYIFEVLSPAFTEVYLTTYEPPLEPFPSGADVVAIGCKRNGYLEAYLAYIPSQDRLLTYGFPWEDTFCDAP